MIAINTTQPAAVSSFSAADGANQDLAPKSASMRPAADVVKLGAAPTAKLGAAPELRAPRADQGAQESDVVSKAGGLAGIIAMLIGMLNQLMLQDSQRINTSSGREVQLAAGAASAQRKAGQAELRGGLAQAGATLSTAAFGTYRATKGANVQIKTTRSNMPKGLESKKFGASKAAPSVTERFRGIGNAQQEMHTTQMLKGGKMQDQGGALRQGGSAFAKVAESNQNLEVSTHRAEQTTIQADGTIAGRTTDIETKTKSMTEDLVNQMRAIRDRDIQSKNDAASHIAQGSR